MYCIDMCIYIYIRLYVCNKLLGEKEIDRERERRSSLFSSFGDAFDVLLELEAV